MSRVAEFRRFAWEPLTPRGVASFAGASLGRLLLVQFICALLLAATVVYFLSHAWFPAIDASIRQLPESGEIRSGKLNWRGKSPEFLGDNRFLAIIVDLSHHGDVRSPAHVQIEFGETNLFAFSLLGRMEVAYPKGWIIAVNRIEARPWWGAWKPPILGITVGVVLIACLLLWAVLATIYFLPVWLVAFFSNRRLDFGGSWKLAGSALMPGALFFAFAILLYTWGALDLIRLCGAAGVGLLIGWVYLFASPFFLPKLAKQGIKNPFANAEKE